MKNSPVFSPFIVEPVPATLTSSVVAAKARRFLLHKSYTFNDEGNIIYEATKPKLFYYGGRPIPLIANPITPMGGVNYNYFMHWGESSDGGVSWNKYGFNEYPLCSAYNVDFDASNQIQTSQINENTKALRWGQSYIFGGENPPFNYNQPLYNSFYNTYWGEYLGQLYHPDARIMECFLNLNEVDIANFKYNDQIFIKNAYFRIIDIHNYQAGTGASVKVKMIKLVDNVKQLTPTCNYYQNGEYYPSFGGVLIPYWVNAADNTTTSLELPSKDCCTQNGFYYVEDDDGNFICYTLD